jgi:hypothetical protein
MKSLPYRSIVVGLVLFVALAAGLAGCFGGGDDNSGVPNNTQGTIVAGGTTPGVSDTVAGETTTGTDDELSTFKSKDPFIPQAQPVLTPENPVVTTAGSTPGGTTPTTSGSTVTTIVKPVNPSTPVTTSGGGTGTTTGSTVPASTTSTTAPHVHTLKILSIAQVGGAGAVTFQVDGSVYREKRVGDVVSTSWGQIKVVDINTSSKVVTLVQGSETLVLSSGQLVYQ